MKWPTPEEIEAKANEFFPLTGQDSYYIDPAVDAQEGFKYAIKWLQEQPSTWPTQEEISEAWYKYRDLHTSQIPPVSAWRSAISWIKHYDLRPPDLEKRKYMRSQAVTLFELIKGFTTETNDNAMKAAIEMANYVLELTNYDYQK